MLIAQTTYKNLLKTLQKTAALKKTEDDSVKNVNEFANPKLFFRQKNRFANYVSAPTLGCVISEFNLSQKAVNLFKNNRWFQINLYI